jgi:chromosome segregation ATPase
VGGLVSEIQVTDKDLFEIIGRGQVEMFSKDKELDAYRVSLETTKGLATEVNALRAAKVALETSNKQLAEKNIQLDQALTESRKERDAFKVGLSQKGSEADGLHSERVSIMSELTRTRDELTTQKAEAGRLAGISHDLQGLYDSSKAELANANAALKKALDDGRELQYQCDDMQKKIDTLTAKKAKAKK